MSVDKKTSYKDQRLTKAQQKKAKAVKQAGIKNFLGKQKTVTVPKKWLSSSDHVVAELAYITPKEQKILLDADLYGSLNGQPNRGPGGIMSLQGHGDGGGSENAGTGGSDGFGGGGEGSDRNHSRFDVGSGYYGETPTTSAPDTKDNDGPQNQIPIAKPKPKTPTFNIHTGPTYKAPPRVPDQIGFSTFGNVPGVDYSAVGPDSKFAKNTLLNQQLLNTPYSFKSKIPSLNFLGNTLGKIGYNVNTKFFSDNSIGGKINPETGQPFGYGIDGYKDYMRQRSLGNVGAYGGTELSQNAINARSGGDNGIMDVYNTPNDPDDGDADGDGDVDQDDFIFRYFDKTGETLQAGAGGVEDLMTQIRKRISNIFS